MLSFTRVLVWFCSSGFPTYADVESPSGETVSEPTRQTGLGPDGEQNGNGRVAVGRDVEGGKAQQRQVSYSDVTCLISVLPIRVYSGTNISTWSSSTLLPATIQGGGWGAVGSSAASPPTPK